MVNVDDYRAGRAEKKEGRREGVGEEKRKRRVVFSGFI